MLRYLRARSAEWTTWAGLALMLLALGALWRWPELGGLLHLATGLGAVLTLPDRLLRQAAPIIEDLAELPLLPTDRPKSVTRQETQMSILDLVTRLQRYEAILPQAAAAVKAAETFASAQTLPNFVSVVDAVLAVAEAVDELPPGTVAASVPPKAAS